DRAHDTTAGHRGLFKRIEAGERPRAREITSEVRRAKHQEAELARLVRPGPHRRHHRAMTAEERAQAEAAKERQQKRLHREEQKRKREQAERLADAEVSANLLADVIRDRLHEFIALVEKVSWWEVKSRLMRS